MQNSNINNSIYKNDCKDFKTDKSINSDKNSFLQGIRNARYLLNKLEKSIRKTSKYEKRLLQCKASHPHMQETNERYETDQLQVNETTSFITEKPSTSLSRSPLDLATSWSTMSIVCLQYQYEELSRRYESLLHAYDERCSSLQARDASAQRLRERVKLTQEQLACTHEAVLSIGDKYLSLRCRKLALKCWYEDKVRSLRELLQVILLETEKVQVTTEEQVARCLNCDHDTAISLLLAETQKCNQLFLENMRLKMKLDEWASK